MRQWTDKHDEIDALLHDAEHAEAGSDFAKMMLQRQPNNADHAKYAKELAEKAVRLKAEAQAIADANGISLDEWGEDGWTDGEEDA